MDKQPSQTPFLLLMVFGAIAVLPAGNALLGPQPAGPAAPEAPPMTLAEAASVVEALTMQQAAALGIEVTEPELPHHGSPSAALRDLAARHGRAPTPEEARQMETLDLLPAAVQAALTSVVDAFLGLEDASRAALGSATSPEGEAWGAVLGARGALLDAAARLQQAMPAPGAPSLMMHGAGDVYMAPVFFIDMGAPAAADSFANSEVYALTINADGSDTYFNNAGGNNLRSSGGCAGGGVDLSFPAAALIDLEGDDIYGGAGDPAASCGINGGGYEGVGVLIDALGDDEYRAVTSAVNGGAVQGVGLLLDVDGDDLYVASGAAVSTNGGAMNGVGALVDLDDLDVFSTAYAGAVTPGPITSPPNPNICDDNPTLNPAYCGVFLRGTGVQADLNVCRTASPQAFCEVRCDQFLSDFICETFLMDFTLTSLTSGALNSLEDLTDL